MKDRKLDWKIVLLAVIISNGVFAVIMIWSLPHLSAIANGQAMFDARPTGYGFEQAGTIINALGIEGQQFYLNTQLKLDIIYPALFAISFSLLIFKFLHGLNQNIKWAFILSIAPLLTGIFDYVENYFIGQMLVQAQNLTEITVQYASWFTVAKSISSTVTQVSALILLIFVIIHKFRKPSHANS